MNSVNRMAQWPAWWTQHIKVKLGSNLKELGLELDRKGSVMTNDIAFMQPLNRHRQVIKTGHHIPQTNGAWIAPNACLVG